MTPYDIIPRRSASWCWHIADRRGRDRCISQVQLLAFTDQRQDEIVSIQIALCQLLNLLRGQLLDAPKL